MVSLVYYNAGLSISLLMSGVVNFEYNSAYDICLFKKI
jgi:hypothetical protein